MKSCCGENPHRPGPEGIDTYGFFIKEKAHDRLFDGIAALQLLKQTEELKIGSTEDGRTPRRHQARNSIDSSSMIQIATTKVILALKTLVVMVKG